MTSCSLCFVDNLWPLSWSISIVEKVVDEIWCPYPHNGPLTEWNTHTWKPNVWDKNTKWNQPMEVAINTVTGDSIKRAKVYCLNKKIFAPMKKKICLLLKKMTGSQVVKKECYNWQCAQSQQRLISLHYSYALSLYGWPAMWGQTLRNDRGNITWPISVANNRTCPCCYCCHRSQSPSLSQLYGWHP